MERLALPPLIAAIILLAGIAPFPSVMGVPRAYVLPRLVGTMAIGAAFAVAAAGLCLIAGD